MRILVVFVSGLVLSACPTKPAPAPVKFGESQGLAACDEATIAAHPDERCFTWRAVAGVSMGGGTSARIGFAHPELFDVVADMGGPITDVEFFLGMIESNQLTGFCSKEKLEGLIAAGVDIDDATNPDVWCGVHDSWPMVGPNQVTPGYLVSAPGSQCALFRSDFNHWYRGPDAGRGGSFGRNTFIESIADLTAIYGNLAYYNPDSNYLPPGVPESFLVDPQGDIGDRCTHPIVVKNFYNKEYNPDGKYDAITFCDGTSGPSGDYDPNDPGHQNHVMDFSLALDMNGNGKRDYGEPILFNGRERFDDFGVDGVADVDEPGYDPVNNPDPNHDDFDPFTNPKGTENNLKFDPGEHFFDDGLDGVPGTNDYGEGDGVFNVAPNIQRALDRSPIATFKTMSESQINRLDIWMDAGIRDFLNTSQNENHLFDAIKERVPDAKDFADFKNLPGITGSYVYNNADYSRKAMGKVAYLRYGDPSICPSSDDVLGSGNHVGPQVVDRLFTLFSFMSARMPAQGRDEAIGGDISDLESPTGQLGDFAFMTSYDSKILGHTQPFGVMLPPDYYLKESKNVRYPVLYFFHGQGQSAQNMSQTGIALWGPMQSSAREDRIRANKTDLQRAIIIWVDGQCQPGECWTGNFYADFEGSPRADRNFEQAFYELAQTVEKTYRVKAPEMIPLSQIDNFERSRRRLVSELEVDILFHGEGLAVFDKPAGLAMHGGVGVLNEDSLHGAILEGFEVERGFAGPSFLGRLDRATSGIVVAALSRAALAAVEPGWRSGAIAKEYLVLVHGKTDATGKIEIPLAARRPRLKGTGAVEEAITGYRTLAGNARVSLLLARIYTGRTHQIRRHMKAIGHPVIGDPRYGHPQRDRDLPLHEGLMLHAARIRHDGTVPILPKRIDASSPERMTALAASLSIHWPAKLPD